jgi:hypothetical protein
MRQRKRIKSKDIQTLTAIDKCLLRVLNINVKFWKTYEMIGESKMYGLKYGLSKGDGSILKEFREDFLKKVVRNRRSTGNIAAEWEFVSEGRRGKLLCSIVQSVRKKIVPFFFF